MSKELSFCHKFWFSKPNGVDLIFQTVNSVRSNNVGKKYQSFTPSGYKDKGTRKYEFVSKTLVFIKLVTCKCTKLVLKMIVNFLK